MKHIKPFILAAVALAAIIAIASLSGCNAGKSAQRKDQQAYERVLGNDSLLAKVGKRIRVAGATKTEVVTVTKTDTIFEPVEKPVPVEGCDALAAFIEDIEFFTLDPKTYKKGSVTVNISKHGVIITNEATTTIKTVEDIGRISALQDSIDQYKFKLLSERKDYATLLQQYNAAANELDQLKQAPKGLAWYWWVLIVAAAIGGVLVLLLKKAIPWVAVVKAATSIFSLLKKKKRNH